MNAKDTPLAADVHGWHKKPGLMSRVLQK
jgi:hypothetical protein